MSTPPKRTEGIDVDTWTDSTAAALSRLELNSAAPLTSPPPVRGTGVALDIPLDESQQPRSAQPPPTNVPAPREEGQPSYPVLRRKSSNRDSLARREALLKGKEGTRRRQRFENSRLLSNPYMTPPEAHDWEVKPTYRVRTVPYGMAALWEDKYAARQRARQAQQLREKEDCKGDKGRVPREVRAKLKRARGMHGLLQGLEEQVRAFVSDWEMKKQGRARGESESYVDVKHEQSGSEELDSSDEEVVFVGRKGQQPKEMKPSGQQERLVFDSLADDNGGRFGRWLVHAIAQYYDLRAWSVTTNGQPAHREAYVGIKPLPHQSMCSPEARARLPQPLWGLV